MSAANKALATIMLNKYSHPYHGIYPIFLIYDVSMYDTITYVIGMLIKPKITKVKFR